MVVFACFVSVFKKFYELDPDAISKDQHARISMDKICQFPELKVNPFR